MLMAKFEDPSIPPFKVGDRVVRKLTLTSKLINNGKKYSQPFKIHIIEFVYYYGWTVFDIHLNKFYAADCVLADIYESPLWEAMKEDNDN